MDPGTTANNPLIGRTVGHYRILNHLGSGGMGIVYEAEDLKLKRRVALKFLPQAYSNDPQWRERFLREARAASALNHPGICTIHEISEDQGLLFLVMELLRGENLRERIRGTPLEEEAITSLGEQIADALAAAHAQGIIHRDIKPQNILLTANFRAKILDFGVAKAMDKTAWVSADDTTRTSDSSAALTGEGAVVGTLNYMSPEQARGEALDARSDIFSLGATLYEIATMQAAFRGETVAVVHDAILNRTPEPITKSRPKFSPELTRIIFKALEKDRELRYQSAADLRADLKRLQAPTTALAEAHRPKAGFGKWALAVFAVLVITTIAIRLMFHPSSGVPRVQFEPVTTFTDSALQPAISPDGHAIAFLGSPKNRMGASAQPDTQLFFKQLPDGEPRQLTNMNDNGKNWPIFTPDGSKVAYTVLGRGFNWSVWEAPVYSGAPHLFLANAEGLSWIDNDHILFSEIDQIGSTHMQVVTARANRTEQRVIYSPPGTGMAHLARLSPDKKWLLVAEMDSVGWLPCRLVPFDGSNNGRPVGPPAAQCLAGGWSLDGGWMYFLSQTDGAYHIWRQPFPDGEPQQLTFGPTEERDLTVAGDGSIYTASGIEESSIWIHDAHGERELTNEGFAFLPSASRNGKKVYFLVRSGGMRSYVNGELWSLELATGRKEHLFPGTVMQHYQISPDDKQVLYASSSPDGKGGLWLADMDLRHPPRQLTHENEFRGFFGLPGEIIYQSSGSEKHIVRMRLDNGAVQRITDLPVLNIVNVSPDGEWVAVTSGRGEEERTVLQALPVRGGGPVVLCDFCIAGFGPSRVEAPPVTWQADGKALFAPLKLFAVKSNKTAAYPLKSGTRPYYLSPINPTSEDDFAKIPGVTLLPEEDAFPGPDGSMYLSSRRTDHANIYRLRILEK